jgi:hypothetical protein
MVATGYAPDRYSIIIDVISSCTQLPRKYCPQVSLRHSWCREGNSPSLLRGGMQPAQMKRRAAKLSSVAQSGNVPVPHLCFFGAAIRVDFCFKSCHQLKRIGHDEMCNTYVRCGGESIHLLKVVMRLQRQGRWEKFLEHCVIGTARDCAADLVLKPT